MINKIKAERERGSELFILLLIYSFTSVVSALLKYIKKKFKFQNMWYSGL